MKTLAQITVGEKILDMEGNRWTCVEKIDPSKAAMIQCKKPVLLARMEGFGMLVAGYHENTLIFGEIFDAKEQEMRRLSRRDFDYIKYAKVIN